MTHEQLRGLLREGESSSLDYKRESYPFEGASDDDKSELLKDLLAFANAERRTDAYILTGVEETSGGDLRVCGISHHADDAKYQQFVNAKTQRPLLFSYKEVEFEGIQIGIFHIPRQSRPIYLKKDFSRLKANTVYVRRGSSTAIADPDEIARMGASAMEERKRPKLEFGFVSADSHEWIGTTLEVERTCLIITESTRRPTIRGYYGMVVNEEYPQLLLEYTQLSGLRVPVALAVRNDSPAGAEAVFVETEIPKRPTLFVWDRETWPDRPYPDFVSGLRSAVSRPAPDIQVKDLGTRWKASADIGIVRPGATVVTQSLLYLGSSESQQIETEAVVYSQDLEPMRIPIRLNFMIEQRMMEMSDWIPFHR